MRHTLLKARTTRAQSNPHLFPFALWPSSFLAIQRQVLGYVVVFLFQLRHQPLVSQIHRAGIFPVVMQHRVKPVHDIFVADLDGQLAAAVEAARRDVDGADDGAHAVGEQQLGVKLHVLELVDLDSDVFQDAQATDPFNQLFLLELVRRPRHEVNLHAAAIGANDVLNDDRVLIALVLQPERVLGLVDELGNPLAAVADAPDEVRMFAGIEFAARPVGLEALDDLVHFMLVGGATA